MADQFILTQVVPNIEAFLAAARQVKTQLPRLHDLIDLGALDEAMNVADEAKGYQLARLAPQTLQPFHAAVSQCIEPLRRLATPLADELTTKYCKDARDACNEVRVLGVQFIAYFRTTDRGWLEKREETLQGYVKKAEEKDRQLAAVLASLEEQLNTAKGIIEDMQQAAGEVGVAKHAEEFESLARRHDTASNMWLVVAAVVGMATLGLMLWFITGRNNDLKDTAGAGEITKYVMFRAVFFALGSYFIVWAARNYRANRHLAVSNRHRATALSTFKTFIAAAAEEPDIKNQVMLETTRAIFAAASTGYGEEPASPTDRLVEIARTIVEKK